MGGFRYHGRLQYLCKHTRFARIERLILIFAATQHNTTMKRKAPETLLEFSDYIIPVQNKRMKLTNHAAIDGWSAHLGQLNDSFDLESPPLSPNFSPESSAVGSPVNSSLDDSFNEMEVLDSSPESSPKKTQRKKTMKSAVEFDVESVLSHDPLMDKPMNCRKPLKILVRAIKWLYEQKNILQKDVSDVLGVR